MSGDSQYLRLRCPQCAWSALCDPGEMVRRLRQAKMLRREGQPDELLVVELFRSAGEKLTCDGCLASGLIVELPGAGDADWGEADADDADWGEARACEACGQPIAAERIELFPGARRCAACQARQELAAVEQVAEYCPKCGAVMTLRPGVRGGVTRYQLRCHSCGR